MKNEESGHRDIGGKWVPETPQAKLRNKLTPFWTLSEILSNERFDKSNEDLVEMITEIANRCESYKKVILELINETEK